MVKPSARVAKFLDPGAVEPHLDEYCKRLEESGYTAFTVRGYFDSVAHFGGWLQRQGVAVEEIDDNWVDAFSNHRCDCPGGRKHRHVSARYVLRVRRFVDYLRRHGVIVQEAQLRKSDSLPSELTEFRHRLLHHRGLSPRTVDRYTRLVRQLLRALGRDPALYDAATIRRVVCDEARRHSRAQAKTVTTALRAYLRFLISTGRCRVGLDGAVPTVAEWRLSSMPRYLAPDAVERVIQSCDTSDMRGIRDRAVLLLLARLGLRAGDIVGLCFDDLDWCDGTVQVRGKGRQEIRLPLPQDVGDGLLDYLERARPRVAIDRVFLCVNAPVRPFATSATVSDIVRFALSRAGIDHPPSRGANLLRHSAATTMLRSGATLEMIATVLRHRSPDTTAYYAKVDTGMLACVVRPWPEDAPC